MQSELSKRLNARKATESSSATTTTSSLESEGERVPPINGQVASTSQTTPTSSPQQQSQLDRQMNYQDAAHAVKEKMQTDPVAVSKEDGDMLHSRETKAFGTTEKGTLASQAQKLASQNEK